LTTIAKRLNLKKRCFRTYL